jgi:hypothetical protein
MKTAVQEGLVTLGQSASALISNGERSQNTLLLRLATGPMMLKSSPTSDPVIHRHPKWSEPPMPCSDSRIAIV